MKKNIPIHLQEIIFGSSDPKISKRISRFVEEGKIKKLTSRVYSKDDYIVALRRLTRKQDPDPYVRMLKKAHEFSDMIYDQNLFEMEKKLRLSNAFFEHTEAKLRIIKDVI